MSKFLLSLTIFICRGSYSYSVIIQITVPELMCTTHQCIWHVYMRLISISYMLGSCGYPLFCPFWSFVLDFHLLYTCICQFGFLRAKIFSIRVLGTNSVILAFAVIHQRWLPVIQLWQLDVSVNVVWFTGCTENGTETQILNENIGGQSWNVAWCCTQNPSDPYVYRV